MFFFFVQHLTLTTMKQLFSSSDEDWTIESNENSSSFRCFDFVCVLSTDKMHSNIDVDIYFDSTALLTTKCRVNFGAFRFILFAFRRHLFSIRQRQKVAHTNEKWRNKAEIVWNECNLLASSFFSAVFSFSFYLPKWNDFNLDDMANGVWHFISKWKVDKEEEQKTFPFFIVCFRLIQPISEIVWTKSILAMISFFLSPSFSLHLTHLLFMS